MDCRAQCERPLTLSNLSVQFLVRIEQSLLKEMWIKLRCRMFSSLNTYINTLTHHFHHLTLILTHAINFSLGLVKIHVLVTEKLRSGEGNRFSVTEFSATYPPHVNTFFQLIWTLIKKINLYVPVILVCYVEGHMPAWKLSSADCKRYLQHLQWSPPPCVTLFCLQLQNYEIKCFLCFLGGIHYVFC